MQGIIELKIKLYLETDVTEDHAQDIVNELDYEIKHKMIADTEIMDFE